MVNIHLPRPDVLSTPAADFATVPFTVNVERNDTGAVVRGLRELGQLDAQVAGAEAAHATYLEKQQPMPPGQGLTHRLQQERELRQWLDKQGYVRDLSEADITAHLKQAAELARADRDKVSTTLLERSLPVVRKRFAGLDGFARRRGDSALRTLGPAELVAACDAAATQGTQSNLMTWLSHKPTAELPYGATDEQLEALLLWNAEYTQRLAEQPEQLRELLVDCQQRVRQLAAAGQLSPVWATAAPIVGSIRVGDMLDPDFLGSAAAATQASYDPRGELTVFPYEFAGQLPLGRVIDHEVGHAYGGFASLWLREAAADVFANLVQGREPFAPAGNINDEALSVVQAFTEKIGVSPTALLDCFLGPDWETNERELLKLCRRACGGEDVLGDVLRAVRAVTVPHSSRGGRPTREYFVAASQAAAKAMSAFLQ